VILFDQQDGIAKITLNRPEKRNALNDEVVTGLQDALDRTAKDKSVRVVLIQGAGRDFCSGLDIRLLAQTANAGVMEHMELAQRLASIFLSIRKHPRPVVSAVRGRALGGGVGIATASDLILASETSQFGYPEVKIGFMPAMVMSLLKRSLGEKRAFEVLTFGDSFSAQKALEFGLINQIYSEADFDAEVQTFVAALASRAPDAVSLTKRLLYHTDSMSFETALEAGIEANALSRLTDDAKRGFERFIRKD
jgi:methylglutaconyl-CoA hydratase